MPLCPKQLLEMMEQLQKVYSHFVVIKKELHDYVLQ